MFFFFRISSCPGEKVSDHSCYSIRWTMGSSEVISMILYLLNFSTFVLCFSSSFRIFRSTKFVFSQNLSWLSQGSSLTSLKSYCRISMAYAALLQNTRGQESIYNSRVIITRRNVLLTISSKNFSVPLYTPSNFNHYCN